MVLRHESRNTEWQSCGWKGKRSYWNQRVAATGRVQQIRSHGDELLAHRRLLDREGRQLL